MKKLTTEEFINRAIIIHHNKYDYSKVEYKNSTTKVCIICPEHGEFWQMAYAHLEGKGCPYCAGKKKYDRETFIKKANDIHKYKYDYSKVEYVNNKTKVCIICPEHGGFWQKPEIHLKGHGCPYCASTYKLTTDRFIIKANDIHKYKYDYSKVEYVNTETKVCIICPEHGEFWQTPHGHLVGQGCPQCSKNYRLTKEDFIERAKVKHNSKYSYELINTLINTETKVCIICPEHGEFWQTPHNHLAGQGCPYCKSSKLEDTIKDILQKERIEFESEKTFKWLKNKGHLYLDFYLPTYNIAIECQGIQHFQPVEKFGGIVGFLERQRLDFLKYKLCKEHNIDILYFSKEKYTFFSEIYTDINLLKSKIYEYRSNR